MLVCFPSPLKKIVYVFWWNRQSEDESGDSTAAALLFITGLLVEGRATADVAATLKVLGHLAQDPHSASEAAFVAVLQTAALQGASHYTLCLHLSWSPQLIAVQTMLCWKPVKYRPRA